MENRSASQSVAQPPCSHGHEVEFYETTEFLVETVGGFVAPGLLAGDAAVIVATPEHREAFLAAFAAAGIDVDAARDRGQLTVLDAAETLASFTVDGSPHPARFAEVVGGVLDRAAEAGREVRVYGEMVALLWEAGDVASTITLEELWNELAVTRRFTLLCAYPMALFDAAGRAEFRRVCETHTAVIPAESYSRLTDSDERRRHVAELQQQNLALRAEIEALRRPQTLSSPGDAATAAGPHPGRRSADEHLAQLGDRYLQAAITGDGAAAEAIVREAITVAGVPETYEQVIGQAMRTVGARWAAGELSIAEEHLATAVTDRVLAAVFDVVLDGRPRSRARFLLAALPGEQHLIGLRMTADLLEGQGFDVRFLGAEITTEALIATIGTIRPAAVGLSLSAHADPASAQGVVDRIRQAHPELLILLGGQGASVLRSVRGARVVADVRELRDAVADLGAGQAAPAADRQATPALRPVRRPGAGALEDAMELLARATSESADIVRDHARRAHVMSRHALEDAVTGLANRRALDDLLIRSIDREELQPLTVLVIDLDDFKAVNDEFGHEVGDRLLRAVARTIVAAVRPGDFVARMGGDEFCVVLPGTGARAAAAIADRIRGALARQEVPGPASASIGIAPHEGDLRATLSRADHAMYAVKRRGGDATRLAP